METRPGPASLSMRHWAIVALAALAFAGLVGMRTLLVPAPEGYGTHEQLGLKACSAIDWFGLPCPGCGVTTAVTWFAHGSPVKALSVQPLGFALALLASLALPLALAATLLRVDLADSAGRVPWRRLWLPAGLFAAAAWAYKALVLVQS